MREQSELSASTIAKDNMFSLSHAKKQIVIRWKLSIVYNLAVFDHVSRACIVVGITMDPAYFVDVDECASNPCQNGATCTDDVNGYTCWCKMGYAGTSCQTGGCGQFECIKGVCLPDSSKTNVDDHQFCFNNYTS